MFKCMWGNGTSVWSLIVCCCIIESVAVGMGWYEGWIILGLAILKRLLRAEGVEVIWTVRSRALRQRACIWRCLTVECGMCWRSRQMAGVLWPSLRRCLRRT